VEGKNMFLYRFLWFLVWLPLRIFAPTIVKGKKNLPKNQKAIMACNHQSNWDPILIDSYLWHNPYILAKHTLFKTKFSNSFFHSIGGIPVNRKEVGVSTIKEVFKLLNDEKKLLIFPQGTRVERLNQGDSVKNGLAMFAIKTRSPIVPMWFMKKPGLFRINKLVIGEPFYLTEFEGQKLTKEVLSKASDIIIQKMLEVRNNELARKSKQKQIIEVKPK